MQCKVCKAIVSKEFRFCPSCGTPIPAEDIDITKKNPETQNTSDLSLSTTPVMLAITGGIFCMGANNTQISLSSFEMSLTPVTQMQYEAVMGKNPSKLAGDTHPVESVTWNEALIYCNKLSYQAGLEPCYTVGQDANLEMLPPTSHAWNRVQCNFGSKGYRLPTEAEWEFAARSGNFKSAFLFSGSNHIDDVAWYGENSDVKTHPVAQKKPNMLGLYDMSGNVNEWCWDYVGELPISPKLNPYGPLTGTMRIKRGGSWLDDLQQCTVLFRSGSAPNGKSSNLGFRVCRSIFNRM